VSRPEIAHGDLGDLPAVVDRWLALAEEQLARGSHVLPEANETVVREEIGRHAADGRLLVARDGGVVGFVTVGVEAGNYAKDATRGVVRAIYVDPDRRGEGIGTALLEAAEAELVDRGVQTVRLEALAANDAGRRFYRRAGYDPHRIVFEKPAGSDNHSKERG
jgi:ribosomal protein S18 acetylase RimI-like enzyme